MLIRKGRKRKKKVNSWLHVEEKTKTKKGYLVVVRYVINEYSDVKAIFMHLFISLPNPAKEILKNIIAKFANTATNKF